MVSSTTRSPSSHPHTSSRGRALLDALRAAYPYGKPSELARQHGLLAYVLDDLGDAAEEGLGREVLARVVDYEAHLAALHALDRSFGDARLSPVVLKGALLAQRLYARPALRSTSDIDLLVGETQLEPARDLLVGVGYAWEPTARERWYRREHHHLHLAHPTSMPLELHFDAYRGFGSRLVGDELLERSVAAPGFRALRVLAPPDELVYLAVHAAAHRFERLGWTLDIALLLERMSDDQLAAAKERAKHAGFLNVLRFAVTRASSLTARRADALGRLGAARELIAARTVDASGSRWRRAMSRVVYSVAISGGPRTAASFLATTVRQHVV